MTNREIPEDCLETARKLPVIQYFEDDDDDSHFVRHFTEGIARAIADERLREREECCKVLCEACASGRPLSRDGDDWCHSWTEVEDAPGMTRLTIRQTCQAQDLRERSQ